MPSISSERISSALLSSNDLRQISLIFSCGKIRYI
jgi:hypothetical protein